MKRSFILPFILLIAIPISYAQPGSLDNTFDSDGIVYNDLGLGVDDYASAICVQSDGKIIVAGTSSIDFSSSAIGLVRYNSDGTLDNTFDSDGIVLTLPDSSQWSPSGIVLQSDGKILVAGTKFIPAVGAWFMVARYNANGSLDNSFDGDGIVTTNITTPAADQATAIALQPDGKIVVTGISTQTQQYASVVRYNIDGSLDNTFDGDGKVLASALFATAAFSVLIQPDSKIVIGGYTSDLTVDSFALFRFNSNGSVDNTFSGDGKVTTGILWPSNQAYQIAIQSDGKIVAAGTSYDTSSTYFSLCRYNADGSLDNSFSTDGKLTTAVSINGGAGSSLLIQVDNKIVVGGNVYSPTTSDFCLVRYNPDGSLDNSFDTDGMVSTNVGTYSSLMSISVQPDLKIIAAGQPDLPGDEEFVVARYISGLNLGLIAFPVTEETVFAYPNPVVNEVNLRYELNTSQNIAIQLCDITGNILMDLSASNFEEAGLQEHHLIFPDILPSGQYFIIISSPNGKVSVKIIK